MVSSTTINEKYCCLGIPSTIGESLESHDFALSSRIREDSPPAVSRTKSVLYAHTSRRGYTHLSAPPDLRTSILARPHMSYGSEWLCLHAVMHASRPHTRTIPRRPLCPYTSTSPCLQTSMPTRLYADIRASFLRASMPTRLHSSILSCLQTSEPQYPNAYS
jgi:hypothetical protein